jgi:hypothetical protein
VSIISALLILTFGLFVRPWYLEWGTTPQERCAALPGDEIVATSAAHQETRAITINASVAQLWPWLAQLGQDRGGFYSYDLLENLVGCEMPTRDKLDPRKQQWEVGDKLWMYPERKANGMGFATLRTYLPGRAMGFGTRMFGTAATAPENGSWSFVLVPIDASHTRFIVRGRGTSGRSLLGLGFDRAIFEPIHFVMERRMMIGLKDLAETGTRHRVVNHILVVCWTLTFLVMIIAFGRSLRTDRWIPVLLTFGAAAGVFQILTFGQPPVLLAAGLTLLPIALLRRASV